MSKTKIVGKELEIIREAAQQLTLKKRRQEILSEIAEMTIRTKGFLTDDDRALHRCRLISSAHAYWWDQYPLRRLVRSFIHSIPLAR